MTDANIGLWGGTVAPLRDNPKRAPTRRNDGEAVGASVTCTTPTIISDVSECRCAEGCHVCWMLLVFAPVPITARPCGCVHPRAHRRGATRMGRHTASVTAATPTPTANIAPRRHAAARFSVFCVSVSESLNGVPNGTVRTQ